MIRTRFSMTTTLVAIMLIILSKADSDSVFADAPTSAICASDFLNSLGACTHITQGEDDATKVAECLRFIGLRAIRDDGSTKPETLNSFIALHKTSGAKVVLLPINGNLAATLAEYETLTSAGALLAAEGPNEPNNWHVTYRSETSSNKTSLPIARFQRDLYAAIKADAKLAGVPVFHSSEAGGSQPDNCGLQFLAIPSGAHTLMPDGTKYADYANSHNYVCDHLKGITEDNIAWNAEDPALNGKWDGLFVEYGHTWWGRGFDGYSKAQLATLPRVTTETGWSTLADKGGHTDAISEEAQGKLFLNLYLDAVKRGWSFTFVYMLRDSPSQGAWGFVRNDYSYKASATYLHNLTTILKDNGSTAAPGKFEYTISSRAAAVHDLLIQKSDGTFELAVWAELAKGGTTVTVNLRGEHGSVKVYDPTIAITPVRSVGKLDLTLTDHPLIIEIGR